MAVAKSDRRNRASIIVVMVAVGGLGHAIEAQARRTATPQVAGLTWAGIGWHRFGAGLPGGDNEEAFISRADGSGSLANVISGVNWVANRGGTRPARGQLNSTRNKEESSN